jgi:hypothetical protein
MSGNSLSSACERPRCHPALASAGPGARVRPLAFDRGHRLLAGLRLGDDHDILERTEQRDEKRPRWPLVISDDDPETRIHEALRVGVVTAAKVRSAGIRISTVVPDPASVVIASVAAEPY